VYTYPIFYLYQPYEYPLIVQVKYRKSDQPPVLTLPGACLLLPPGALLALLPLAGPRD
jgi:hypothetical protein